MSTSSPWCTAGYPAAVAPLGTALTEDQLGLLWKMADEPILCFDGDKAGQRAAFRAVDMALPRLAPGKSLRFAMLPEGQDPDDLYRSGGREAIAEVLDGARPLGEMLWSRETDAASLDTPERRAAFEARVHEVVRGIGDEFVRKYYAQDFSGRLRALMAPPAPAGRNDRPRAYSGQFGGPGAFRQCPRVLPRARGLAARPRRACRSRRRAERAAQRQPDRARLPHRAAAARGADPDGGDQPSVAAGTPRRGVRRAGIPQSRRRSAPPGGAGCRQPTAAPPIRRCCERRSRRAASAAVLARVEAAITHTSDWPARPGAVRRRRWPWWTHVVTLHRKQRTLNKELKDAERALGEEPTDANLAWLRDVQGRLSALDGSEAQIEGFGLSSGRPARSI